MAMTRELLLQLPFEQGEVYAIGTTPTGILLAVGTMENEFGKHVLAVIAESSAEPVPLDSFAKFMVPVEFYDEPKRWEGKV